MTPNSKAYVPFSAVVEALLVLKKVVVSRMLKMRQRLSLRRRGLRRLRCDDVVVPAALIVKE